LQLEIFFIFLLTLLQSSSFKRFAKKTAG